MQNLFEDFNMYAIPFFYYLFFYNNNNLKLLACSTPSICNMVEESFFQLKILMYLLEMKTMEIDSRHLN